jgi:hypothetical protein
VRSLPLSSLWPHLSASPRGSVIPTAGSDSLAALCVRPAHHHGAACSSLPPLLCYVPIHEGLDCLIVSRYVHVLLVLASGFVNGQTILADTRLRGGSECFCCTTTTRAQPLAYHVQNSDPPCLKGALAVPGMTRSQPIRT